MPGLLGPLTVVPDDLDEDQAVPLRGVRQPQPVQGGRSHRGDEDVRLREALLDLGPARALRSIVTTSWPRASSSYQLGATIVIGSPAGGSTFVTRAPREASRAAASGPGRLMASETTRTPVRVWFGVLTAFGTPALS